MWAIVAFGFFALFLTSVGFIAYEGLRILNTAIVDKEHE